MSGGDGRRRRAEARWVWGISAAMIAAGVALVARGSSPPPSTSLPRFEPHGRDVGVALGIEEGPTNEEVAAEVKRDGFYAGAPVGSRRLHRLPPRRRRAVGVVRAPLLVVQQPLLPRRHRRVPRREGRGRVALLRQLPRAVPGRDRRDGSAGDRSRHARGAGRRHLPGLPFDRARRSRRQRPLRGRPAPGADGEGRARRRGCDRR